LEAGIGAPAELDQIKLDGGLGLFVRSLVGLDREAANSAFANFIAGRALTANQIQFLNTVIDHLTAKGQMDPGLLYESPFTDYDAMGVAGVFNPADTQLVISILDEVRNRAVA
jgi:type I restriction enzyme R subunit